MSLDLVTPWLAQALEARLGGSHTIEVGGTQLERSEEGLPALRLRDIIVRDEYGLVVASAPKAEVGLSGLALLTGQLQAKRLSLIGAMMSGLDRARWWGDHLCWIRRTADRHCASGASTTKRRGRRGGNQSTNLPRAMPPPRSGRPFSDGLAAISSWLERLDVLGLDGGELSEVGLKNGSVAVDDARTGKRWMFGDINLSVRRPKEGGIALAVRSTGTDGPWSLTATASPRGNGKRAIEAVVKDLSPKDLMLALRMSDPSFEADMPISAIVRGEIGPDGVPTTAEARVVIGAGYLGSPNDEEDRIVIDGAHIDARWNAEKRQLTVPIEITAGPNRMSLTGEIDAPSQGVWQFAFTHGQIMLAANDRIREAPLVLDHVVLAGHLDQSKRRLELEHGDVSGAAAGLAFSGVLDFSGPKSALIAGLAATRMSASSLKRIWPVFVQTKVRKWAIDHVLGGSVERLVIATNAPLTSLRAAGPPVPDDGISIDLVGTGVQIQPIATLPVIRDSDLVMRVLGRHVTVTIGRGLGGLTSGRKLAVSKVWFDVAILSPRIPPPNCNSGSRATSTVWRS